MTRAKIDELARYPFKTELVVRVYDLNYGGHLGYDRVLSLIHQARVELFASFGATETDLGDGATGIVAADVVVQYRGEAFLNDVLEVEICPVEVGMVSFRLSHRITQKKTGKTVALAEVGFVAFDYTRRKPCRLLEAFARQLNNLNK